MLTKQESAPLTPVSTDCSLKGTILQKSLLLNIQYGGTTMAVVVFGNILLRHIFNPTFMTLLLPFDIPLSNKQPCGLSTPTFSIPSSCCCQNREALLHPGNPDPDTEATADSVCRVQQVHRDLLPYRLQHFDIISINTNDLLSVQSQ